MAEIRKACAVPHRRSRGRVKSLAFRHPVAGLQLVKGTVEAGESPLEAAVRELWEERGIATSASPRHLGQAPIGVPPGHWPFFAFDAGPLSDAWDHRTSDDGGQVFFFFWHPLRADPDDRWHPTFREALAVIRRPGHGLG